MRKLRPSSLPAHGCLLLVLLMSAFPFVILGVSSFRSSPEISRSTFGLPREGVTLLRQLRGERIELEDGSQKSLSDTWYNLTVGYKRAWRYLGVYIPNTILVAMVTGFGVAVVASLSAYILARFRFWGSRVLFFLIISLMMIPGVLTLIPSFLLIKKMGLLNSYLALILPYIAGGQIFAIFLLKGFFEDLPQDLFDSAEIDGAGHFQIYRYIVLPLSKPIVYLIFALNILSVWNNFIWPFIVNSDPDLHIVASGIFVLSRQMGGQGDLQSLYAAYILSAIPMLILFILATRVFLQGITAGAFKA